MPERKIMLNFLNCLLSKMSSFLCFEFMFNLPVYPILDRLVGSVTLIKYWVILFVG